MWTEPCTEPCTDRRTKPLLEMLFETKNYCIDYIPIQAHVSSTSGACFRGGSELAIRSFVGSGSTGQKPLQICLPKVSRLAVEIDNWHKKLICIMSGQYLREVKKLWYAFIFKCSGTLLIQKMWWDVFCC